MSLGDDEISQTGLTIRGGSFSPWCSYVAEKIIRTSTTHNVAMCLTHSVTVFASEVASHSLTVRILSILWNRNVDLNERRSPTFHA